MTADKHIYHDTTGSQKEREALVTSTGAPDAGKHIATDVTGRIDPSLMPVGVGADTQSVQASENLASGDFVNIHIVSGNFRVRKADGSTVNKEADGFVLAGVVSPAMATVYVAGVNTAITGATAGPAYLSGTAGGFATVPPVGTGKTSQRIGTATSATTIAFQRGPGVQLA